MAHKKQPKNLVSGKFLLLEEIFSSQINTYELEGNLAILDENLTLTPEKSAFLSAYGYDGGCLLLLNNKSLTNPVCLALII